MFKSSLAIIFFISISLFAQNNWSVEISGGIVVPQKAKNGTSIQLQTNYNDNNDFTYFASINYQNFGYLKRTISTDEQLDTFDQEKDHRLYSFSLGSFWNFISYKNFTSFLSAEAGLGYLEYNKSRLREIYINNEISTMGIETKRNEEKLVYNIGFGLGVSNRLTEFVDVNLQFKHLSIGGKNYIKIGENNSFITQILFGVKYNL